MDWSSPYSIAMESLEPVELYPHSFGTESDLCHYCGISEGWFGRNRGKHCSARVMEEVRLRKKKSHPIVITKARINPSRIQTGRKFR